MFNNQYPYTDFHELNLDWFLAEFKKVTDKVTTLDATVQEFTAFVTNYFDNLDVQEEINRKLEQMVDDGSLTAMVSELFDEFRAETDQEINTIRGYVNEQNEKIGILENRMDTFASLEEGSTTGDAELMDARVGIKNTYPSAGDAIRAQVSDLVNDMTLLKDSTMSMFGFGDFESCGLNPDGSSKPSETWRCSNTSICIFDYDLKLTSADTGFQFGYIDFDENDDAIGWHGWYTNNTIAAGTKFKIQIKRETEDQSETSDVYEFSSALTAHMYYKMPGELKKTTMTIPHAANAGLNTYTGYDFNVPAGGSLIIRVDDPSSIITGWRLYMSVGTAAPAYFNDYTLLNDWIFIKNTLAGTVQRIRVMIPVAVMKTEGGVVIGGNTYLSYYTGQSITKASLATECIDVTKLDADLRKVIPFNSGSITYSGSRVSLVKNKCERTQILSVGGSYTPVGTYNSKVAEGMAIYGKYAFGFCLQGSCFVTDLDTNTVISDFLTDVGSTYTTHAHCNSASFSSNFDDISDPFPLLYLSQCYNVNEAACWVLRMTTSSSQLVQTINYNNADGAYTGNYDWILDDEGGRIMTYGKSNGKHRIKVFNLPLIGPDVTFTPADAIDDWIVEDYMNGKKITTYQGNTIYNGMLFLPDGVYGSNHIWIFDLSSHALLNDIPLDDYELEDVAVYKEELILYEQNSNYGNYRKITF